MPYDYDLIVIGGGAGGLTAAGMSALLGAKTALIEHHRLGGDCTWTGCIPSKTLLRAAAIAHQTRTSDGYGLSSSDPRFEFSRLMRRVREVRKRVYEDADAPPNLEKLGVEVLLAHARFLDPHTVEVKDGTSQPVHLSSRYFIIATGSRPRTPHFKAPVLNNENVFELDAQPARLLVLGAGPVGIEMAQAFRRLGSDVTVVASGERILGKDDPELTAALQAALANEGIVFRLGRRLTEVEQKSGTMLATIDDGKIVECDAILAAIGRQPILEDLGLDAAGVSTEKTGIRIDRHCRTSRKHIYASGDVTGKFLFTHMAEHMSKVAVSNAILHLPVSMDEKRVTWCTFTQPELAHAGSSESDLRHPDRKYTVYRFPFTKLDRAITENETTGLVKVLADSRGRILGASILGAHAGEMIGEWAVAMKGGLKLKEIADTIHPYPTYILGNRRTADQWYARQLRSPLISLAGKLFGYRGVRKTEIKI